MPDPETGPETGKTQLIVRRRPTRRHRRNRLIRRWLALAVLAVFVAVLSTAALRYLSPSLFNSAQVPTITDRQAELIEKRTPSADAALSNVEPARPVYPYSVVPGGVEDVRELKWVAEHDPIVAAHYAGFDYARAQVVRLTLARTVYVSYRIGNNIYWTSHRVTLHKGEKLITDGRMTARTRCANRVEETPQQQSASPGEPTAEKLDQPVYHGEGTAMRAPPLPYESALMPQPQSPGPSPMGPLSLYDPFVGGSFISVSVPPLTFGLCEPIKKKEPGSAAEVESMAVGKKKTPGPCGEGGGIGTVPEPGTWILFASGLVAIVWWSRRKLLSAGASTASEAS